MTLPRALALAWLLIATGCAYHNVLFNARTLYEQGETFRRTGDPEQAEVYYRGVVRKTGDALRARPDSDWAIDALALLGRAEFRLGDVRAARGALDEVVRQSSDPGVRGSAQVYLALISEDQGDRRTALREVNAALEAPLPDDALAEAHLLRGRLMLAQSYADHGWWDLDRATDVDERIRQEAGLERLGWGIRQGDRERSVRAMTALLADRGAGARSDTIVSLVRTARDRWGAAGAAALLEDVDGSAWDGERRARLALVRANLLDEAGDRAAAVAQALRVADGLGTVAAEARILLASWRAEAASDLVEVYAVRGVLLPAGNDPRVTSRLAAVDELEAFAGVGLDEPLGWFAAAEVARDRLGANYVARGLFLAYADGAPDDPWAPKALLAALEISPDAADRAWLRGRLEAHADSPYVLAAHGGSATGFEALEEELDLRLRALIRR